MHLFSPAAATPSNHTETSSQLLLKRATYVAAHREYISYLRHLLDTATLPASAAPLPNITTMAAMVAEMRAMHPAAPWLNSVVLGRLLQRILSPLLSWHGGQYTKIRSRHQIGLSVETTVYRFPEVRRSRIEFEKFIGRFNQWSNSYDQWRFAGHKTHDHEDFLETA